MSGDALVKGEKTALASALPVRRGVKVPNKSPTENFTESPMSEVSLHNRHKALCRTSGDLSTSVTIFWECC